MAQFEPSLSMLADSIPWFGKHSGYEQLARFMVPLAPRLDVIWSRTTLNQIRLGKWYARFQRRPWREDRVYAAAELRFHLHRLRRRPELSHILYGDGHHYFFEQWQEVPPNIIATLHHPMDQWSDWHPSLVKNIGSLNSAIVLYRRDLAQFEELIGPGRVLFVRHGVDTDFFQPGKKPTANPPRILYVGQNGRNTDMVLRMVNILCERYPDLRFDFIVRSEIRQRYESLRKLLIHPNISWYDGLTDHHLRELYQRSLLLLLPMDVCGAVNAILEAMACGLPVVTTNVGGIPDYGGGDIYPIVENDDDQAMLALVDRYLNDLRWRQQIANASRRFAVSNLAWPKIVQAHFAAYRYLADL